MGCFRLVLLDCGGYYLSLFCERAVPLCWLACAFNKEHSHVGYRCKRCVLLSAGPSPAAFMRFCRLDVTAPRLAHAVLNVDSSVAQDKPV